MAEKKVKLPLEQLGRLADFCNEVGMLRHTPRSGYAFLGSGRENVAEHSYRVSVLGYALARELAEAILRTDPNRWWYGQVEKDWWIHHQDPAQS